MNEHAKAFQICTPRSAMLRGEAGPEGIFAVNQRDVGTAEQREVARRTRTGPAAHYGATCEMYGPQVEAGAVPNLREAAARPWRNRTTTKI